MRITSGIIKRSFKVRQAKDEGDQEDHAQEAIEHVRGEHRPWNGLARVFDLFRLDKNYIVSRRFFGG